MITLATPGAPPPAAAPRTSAGAPAAADAAGAQPPFAELYAETIARHASQAMSGDAREDSAQEDPALSGPPEAPAAQAGLQAEDPLAHFAPWTPAQEVPDTAIPASPAPQQPLPTRGAAAQVATVIPAGGTPAHDVAAPSAAGSLPALPDDAQTALSAPGPVPAASASSSATRPAGRPGAAAGLAARDAALPAVASPRIEIPVPVAAVQPAPRVSTDAATATPANVAPAGALAAAAAPAGAHDAAPVAPAGVRIETPFGGPGWGSEIATRITLLVRERVSEAQLTLDPAELGPVHARIRVEDGTTTVTLVAARPETRDALEAALPRLREQLESGGMSLGQASVSHEGPQHGEPGTGSAVRAPEAGASDPRAPAVATQALRARGLVDLYA